MSTISIANFNAPELNELALYLADRGTLHRLIRPYLNKGRGWERALARVPLVGGVYSRTFGRRSIGPPSLMRLTREAGIAADFAAALVTRLPGLPAGLRLRTAGWLHEQVRSGVSARAARESRDARHVIAYPGFGLAAFGTLRGAGGLRVVSYPIAHHRYHLALRADEIGRVPEFASTWPALDHFTEPYLATLDAEIDAADLVIVGSDFVRRTFVAQGIDADKIAVVPYGVDPRVFGGPASVERDGRFRVAFVGQIGQRKGLSYLLDGYRRFARDDTRLLLIGHPAGSTAPLARHAALYEHVPHLTRPELARRLAGCDVFVFPTLLEGMPLVVLEAMACGLPVIATANGPDEVVRDGVDGFIVPSRDAEAIADRLERLYRDPELRARMGRAAQARAREFTWRAFAAGVESVLLAKGGG